MTRRKRVENFRAVEAQLRALERGDGEGTLTFGDGSSLHV
jgi:hypothetical protein